METKTVETTSVSVKPVSRLRVRFGIVLALIVGIFGAGAGAALADTPTPAPADPSLAVGALASGLNNGVINTLTANIPYIVGLLVMFTVIAAVRRHTGAKRG